MDNLYRTQIKLSRNQQNFRRNNWFYKEHFFFKNQTWGWRGWSHKIKNKSHNGNKKDISKGMYSQQIIWKNEIWKQVGRGILEKLFTKFPMRILIDNQQLHVTYIFIILEQ